MKILKAKKRTSVKGMTLIECIISILVVGIAGLIMVTAGTTAAKLMRETNHLNNKTNAEAPVVNVRDVDALRDPSDGSFYAVNDADGNAIVVESDTSVTVGSFATYNVKKYNVASAAAHSSKDTQTNMRGDLEFYIVETNP